MSLLFFPFWHFYKATTSRLSIKHHNPQSHVRNRSSLSSLSRKLKGTLEHGISQEFQFVDHTQKGDICYIMSHSTSENPPFTDTKALMCFSSEIYIYSIPWLWATMPSVFIFIFFFHRNCCSKCRHSAHVNFRPHRLFFYLLCSVTRRRFICALKFGILSNYWRISLGNWRAHSPSTFLHLPYEDHLIYIIDSNSHLKWDTSYGAGASAVDCLVIQ